MTTRTRSVCVADHEARRLAQGLPTLLVRPVKEQPDWIRPCVGKDGVAHGYCGSGPEGGVRCPFGRVGDVLAIREAWTLAIPAGASIHANRVVHYRADDPRVPHWKSAATMPLEFVRSRPTVAAIRVGMPCELGGEDIRNAGIDDRSFADPHRSCSRGRLESRFKDVFTKRYGEAAWERPAWLVTVGGKAE